MKAFTDYMIYLGGRLLIGFFIWGLILLCLFIVIGLFIGVAQVILGGTADILVKYSAIIAIGIIIYGTFEYITNYGPNDTLPHEET